MIVCASCGTNSAESAKFCAECGARLVVAPTGEVRKFVTVLFADVADSTAIGERLDPESSRALMARYFAIARSAIERHGGAVEKFIGDAVMAVFGIPILHGDDALRAVRAASEMRDRIGPLADEVERQHGVAFAIRIGIMAGEVVAGDPTSDTLVTGDPVNTAARLEQAAGRGEILLGAPVHDLVRDTVDVERIEPIVAKGKRRPVDAYRLLTVRVGDGRERRLEAEFVGRAEELAQLKGIYRRSVVGHRPSLVTIVAAAGVGKSRLAGQLVSTVATDARVLRGRCLAYGEGTTYWPIREALHGAAGIGDEAPEAAIERIRVLLGETDERELIATRLATLAGLNREAAPQDELFWAVRRAFEQIARRGPTILLVEDLHWAEPPLLELLPAVVSRTRMFH